MAIEIFKAIKMVFKNDIILEIFINIIFDFLYIFNLNI